MSKKIERLFVGPDAPTDVQSVAWIDTVNAELKVFGPNGWISIGGGGGGLSEEGTPGNFPVIGADGESLVNGTISQSELSAIITLIGTWDAETVAMVRNASTLSYYLNLIIGYNEMPTFSSSTSYALGDLVLKEGVLYRFTTPHAGTWSDADVIITNFYKEFVRYYSGASEEEIVNVQLNFDSTTPSFTGKYITTVVNSVETQHEIGSTGLCQFTLAKHTQYTIKFPVFDGYTQITDRVYTAYLAQRTVDATYHSTGGAITEENVVVETSFTTGTGYPSGVVTVVDNTASTTTNYNLDQSGQCTFTVPLNHNYTVQFPINSGYITTSAKTFNASLARRVITSKYAPVNTGIFYMDANLNQYTYAQWVAAGKQGTEAKYIYFSSSTLASHGANFFINLDDLRTTTTIPTKQWLSSNVQVNTLQNFGSKALAIADYGVTPYEASTPGSGPISNQLAIKSFIDNQAQEGYNYSSQMYSYAITKNLTINGATYNAYIGTAAQWQFLSVEENYSALNQMINHLHQTDNTVPSDLAWTSKTFWTSTQYSATISWILLNGSLYNNYNKNSSYSVLCFYAL